MRNPYVTENTSNLSALALSRLLSCGNQGELKCCRCRYQGRIASLTGCG